MASKMSAAIDSDGKKITIAMAENSDYKNPLRCEFCDAHVTFVNGYPREVGDKIVLVSPFFRLKTNYAHGAECKYNVAGQIKIIVRESEGDILAQTESGKFELRLLAVKKAIQELQELANQKKNSDAEPKNEAKEKEYVKSGNRLGSYINSALRVLKVRALCEENTEIENALELVFDGVRLSWRDFYYEDVDYFRCYSNIKKATVKTPIAVKGIVKSNKVINGKSGPLAIINLAGPYRKTDEVSVLDAAGISIWSHDLDAFKGYKVDDEILAFGLWNAQDTEVKSNLDLKSPIKKYRNHNLRLWPVIRAQLCKVDG